MKAKAKYYKGIEFIVVSDLPAEQQELLEQRNIEHIKILVEGKIVGNCISYKDYNDWFLTTFKQRTPISKPIQAEAFPIKIAFTKA